MILNWQIRCKVTPKITKKHLPWTYTRAGSPTIRIYRSRNVNLSKNAGKQYPDRKIIFILNPFTNGIPFSARRNIDVETSRSILKKQFQRYDANEWFWWFFLFICAHYRRRRLNFFPLYWTFFSLRLIGHFLVQIRDMLYTNADSRLNWIINAKCEY